MRAHAIAVVAAVLSLHPSIGAAQARGRPALRERPVDLMPGGGAAARRPSATAAEAALAGTGDPDSFGRGVRYLGVAQTLQVSLLSDCTAADPATERCVTLAASPGLTEFLEQDLARIDLPAKATHSLVCFTFTPFTIFEFLNDTGVQQPFASFNASAEVIVESSVLDDPALVDPATGLPFAGKLSLALGTYGESRSLAVDERARKRLTLSRDCIGGLLSRSALVGVFGLSEAQATEFFKRPMTLRFGSAGSASLVSFATYFYGIRLYGD